MSRAVQAVWKVVVAAKARTKERLERELADARRRLEVLNGEVEEAQSSVQYAQAQRLAHEERIGQLLSDSRGLSPSVYLNHDHYRAPLAQALDAARTGLRTACEASDAQQHAVERLGMQVRRADAALDAAREQLRAATAAMQRRIDERVDEEACESAAVRIRRGG
jgi:predicted  nucleic acid-binding Zn-ribbon protein